MSDEKHYAIFKPGAILPLEAESDHFAPTTMTAYRAGSVGANYNLGRNDVPCLVIYGPTQDRIAVLRGDQILEVVRFWLGFEP